MRGAVPVRLLRLVLLGAIVLAACGQDPLSSIGLRSSEWINEPTVPTTVRVEVTTPTVIDSSNLLWATDEVVVEDPSNVEAVLAAVFARRQGDRFIQASRFEIAAALPDVAFPAQVPFGAEWVSSQLVMDNDGTLADDPSAAFGIWSVEPYTRSRSVAQMIVIRVYNDLVGSTELSTGEVEPSCARFAERTTDECEILVVGIRDTWRLTSSGDTTLIWFEGPYRYELFGRSFVPEDVLTDMSGSMVPLSGIDAQTS